MSAACRATSVPAMPIATPISAARSAGASFTPSPVAATMARCRCSVVTMRSFWSAATRANRTCGASSAAHICASDMRRTWSPVTTSGSLSGNRPISRPIATAVCGWSPVTITIRIPARRQRSTAADTSGRGGSSRPTSASSTRSSSRCVRSYASGSSRWAKASTRRPCWAIVVCASRNVVASTAVSGWRPAGSETQLAGGEQHLERAFGVEHEARQQCGARSRAASGRSRTESRRSLARLPESTVRTYRRGRSPSDRRSIVPSGGQCP